MKKKLNKWKIFKLINIVLIFGLMIFYSYRLYHYWNLQKESQADVKLLVDSLLQNVSYIDQENGLIDNKNETYTYKGKTEYNYIKYSGRIFRILSIDSKKNIKIVREESDAILGQDSADDYNDTLMKTWLNDYKEENGGVYYNTLNNQDMYLAKTTECLDEIDDVENITCTKEDTTSYVSLLSLSDYEKAGGASSFLNNGENFWLVSRNTENKFWNVAEDGGLNVLEKTNAFNGIRPVLTLRYDTPILGGKGTKTDPYLVEDPKVKTEFVMDTNVGDFISYGGYTWKVIERSVESVKLALNGYVKVDGEDVLEAYNTNDKNLFENKKGSIAYYLNNEFYDSLTDNSLIETSTWYDGKIEDYDTYNYKDLYSDSVDLKVGMLKLDDLFVNEFPGIFLTSRPYGNDSNLIYTINNENKVFVNFVSEKLKVRPAIKVAGSTIIKSGKGTEAKPYKMEVVEDEQSSME